MGNRLDGDQALDIARQVVADNPGISQEEMNEKAERLARMVRENLPPAKMPISRAGPSMQLPPMTAGDTAGLVSEIDAPIRMATIPQYQKAEEQSLQGQPDRLYNRSWDFIDEPRMAPWDRTRTFTAAERRQTPGTSVTMDYTMAESQKLAQLRSDPAFDVGFRQGINDYEKMKLGSPRSIIDDLSGSTDEANMARSSLFRGDTSSADIKRLGYAEAMEYAERNEKITSDKALRRGMMNR